MANPFRLRWLDGWTFQTVLMEGDVQVEARGFGICLRTRVQPGETPRTAADRLVLEEDRRRRSLHHAWLRGQTMPESTELGSLPGAQPDLPSPVPAAEADASLPVAVPEPSVAVNGTLPDAAAPLEENDASTTAEALPAAGSGALSEASNVVRPRDSQLSRSLN